MAKSVLEGPVSVTERRWKLSDRHLKLVRTLTFQLRQKRRELTLLE
jgi:hypothetical protein